MSKECRGNRLVENYREYLVGTTTENYLDRLDMGEDMSVVLGVKGSQDPYIVNWDEEVSGIIVGGSGAGKSSLLNHILVSLLVSKSERDMQIYLFDLKNSPGNQELSKAPHVLNYITDIPDFEKHFIELENEMDRRLGVLISEGYECIKDYHKDLVKEGRDEEANSYALLTVVVDELTTTLERMKNDYPSNYERVVEIMGSIAQKGRTLGIKLLVVGQSTKESFLPKTVLENSSLRMVLRDSNDTHFKELIGGYAIGKKPVENVGEAWVVSAGNTGAQHIQLLMSHDGSEKSKLVINQQIVEKMKSLGM